MCQHLFTQAKSERDTLGTYMTKRLSLVLSASSSAGTGGQQVLVYFKFDAPAVEEGDYHSHGSLSP